MNTITFHGRKGVSILRLAIEGDLEMEVRFPERGFRVEVLSKNLVLTPIEGNASSIYVVLKIREVKFELGLCHDLTSIFVETELYNYALYFRKKEGVGVELLPA